MQSIEYVQTVSSSEEVLPTVQVSDVEPFLDATALVYDFSETDLINQSESVTSVKTQESQKKSKENKPSSKKELSQKDNMTNPVPGSIITQGLHGGNAIDFGAPVGSSVIAYKSGVVRIATSTGWNGGYGSYIVIDHDDGTSSLYAHLSTVNVIINQPITAGEPIGAVGMTGRTTGPHLHFSVIGGVNPFAY